MFLRSLVMTLSLMMLWQAIVYVFQFPSYILPGPLAVLHSLVHNFSLIMANTWPTLVETISGLVLGICFGSLLALLMYLIPTLGFWLLPLMIISQAIPTFAVAPLLVLWFGYGLSSKIATITLMLFFPVASGLYYGLQQTPTQLLDLNKVMNGKRLLALWHLQLPAAKPAWQNGIRIATVLAPIGAIISEWIGSSQGLGFLLLNANARLEIELMFACLLIIIVLSLGLYGFMVMLLRYKA